MSISSNPFEVSWESVSGNSPFGREEVIREIFDRLIGNPIQGAESFSLVGPRYIGKTTILRILTIPEIQQQYLGDAARLHIIYLDCADLPSARREVFRLLGNKAVEIARIAWQIEFSGTIASEYISQLATGSEMAEITGAFEGLFKDLSSRYDRYIVFALDNFEKLLSLFTETDIQFLRDIFSNTKHALIVATPRPIREHSPKTFPSKFYEIFKKYHLQAFSRDQAYNYLTETAQTSKRQFSHSEKEVILRKSGNHPYFLSVYAAEVWRKKLNSPPNQTTEDFARVDRKAKARLSEAFLSIWSALDRDLQAVLYKFATEQIQEESIIRILQRLEDEYAVVYRSPSVHFEVMGELFKEFVISQTEVLDHLLKTDFYRAGLNVLKQLREDKYFDTDPEYYYQKAFQQFASSDPDYDSANAMIRNTFERLLDVMVKRSEPLLGRALMAAGYKEKMTFIEEAFEIEDRISRLIHEFWSVSNVDGPHPGKQANPYNTQLRFYILSGVIQYLINAKPKK